MCNIVDTFLQSVNEKGKGTKKDSRKKVDKRKSIKDKQEASKRPDSSVRRSRSSSPMKIGKLPSRL